MNGKAYVTVLGTGLAAALVLLGCSRGLAGTAAANAQAEREEMLAALLPGGAPFAEESYTGEDENITAVYAGTGGYVIETVTAGYAGDIALLVGVDTAGRITGAVVRDMCETFGLGQTALNGRFLSLAMGRSGELTVGEDGLDAITGATVTSKALVKGLNSAMGYVTGADVNSGATEWGG